MFYDANLITYELKCQIDAARDNSTPEDFTNFLDALYVDLSVIWKEVHDELQKAVVKRCN